MKLISFCRSLGHVGQHFQRRDGLQAQRRAKVEHLRGDAP